MSFALSVYPRACGATGFGGRRPRSRHGLSPRMRGNRPDHRHLRSIARSIPAHAGQPCKLPAISFLLMVYPRACGATADRRAAVNARVGLSPRMRGNLRQSRRRRAALRSIPAHAGQPARYRRERHRRAVYPRACGATAKYIRQADLNPGLSPRMRGNPRRKRHTERLTRSIPAHAGQPRVQPRTTLAQGVYPRACGATAFCTYR